MTIYSVKIESKKNKLDNREIQSLTRGQVTGYIKGYLTLAPQGEYMVRYSEYHVESGHRTEIEYTAKSQRCTQ